MDKSITLREIANELKAQAEHACADSAMLVENDGCGWVTTIVCKKSRKGKRNSGIELPAVLLEGIRQQMMLLVGSAGGTSEMLTMRWGKWTISITVKNLNKNEKS